MQEKLKSFFEHDLHFTALLLVLVAGASFALGRHSVPLGGNGEVALPAAVRMTYTEVAPQPEVPLPPTPPAPTVLDVGRSNTPAEPAVAQSFVASQSGTRYYHVSCGSANRIKEENKVFFATEMEAQAAGYTRALNCPYFSN